MRGYAVGGAARRELLRAGSLVVRDGGFAAVRPFGMAVMKICVGEEGVPHCAVGQDMVVCLKSCCCGRCRGWSLEVMEARRLDG